MKGKKKLLAVFLAAAVSAAAALTVFAAGVRRRDGRETVVSVFENANFDQLSCRLSLESHLDSEYHMLTEKEEFLRKLYEGWAEQGAAGPVITREDSRKESVMRLSCEETGLEFSYYTEEEQEDGAVSQENYLKAQVFLEGEEAEKALELQDRLGEAAAGMGISGTVCLELTGSFSGLLTREEQEIVAEALLDRMGARRVAAVEEEQLYTIYAYGEGAGPVRQLPEGQVNLNLAVSWDEAAGETVFRLGCPIIREDY